MCRRTVPGRICSYCGTSCSRTVLLQPMFSSLCHAKEMKGCVDQYLWCCGLRAVVPSRQALQQFQECEAEVGPKIRLQTTGLLSGSRLVLALWVSYSASSLLHLVPAIRPLLSLCPSILLLINVRPGSSPPPAFSTVDSATEWCPLPSPSFFPGEAALGVTHQPSVTHAQGHPNP